MDKHFFRLRWRRITEKLTNPKCIFLYIHFEAATSSAIDPESNFFLINELNYIQKVYYYFLFFYCDCNNVN